MTRALQLLRGVKAKELSVKEAVALIEMVTGVPELVRAVLEEAEKQGLIRRVKGKIILKFGAKVSGPDFYYPRLKRVRCLDKCKKCGREITNCYFILLEELELGPFGSKCIKKMKLA